MKGLIALDIDGTIVEDMKPLAPEVQHYFLGLAEQGWVFVFITGRTFHFAYEVLSSLPFPYVLAFQNGAVILEMPDRLVLSKKYLDRGIIPYFEKICRGQPTDFVIYSGFERQDTCYYRPEHFSPDLIAYLNERKIAFKENWEQLGSFEDLEIPDFASVKCFGTSDYAFQIAQGIESEIGLHVPVIKDPFREGYFVVQATHPEVNKGEALSEAARLLNYKGPIIAAGDDNNDRSMLAKASIRIVMSSAPMDMQSNATVIAPPASKKGIIEGLEQAIKLYPRQ